MDENFPQYLFLGYQRWAKREDIPASLLAAYDRTVTVARSNPAEIDPETGRAFGAVWLDAADAIRARVEPLLNRTTLRASLEVDNLRKRGNQRSLDAMFSRPVRRP